MTKIALTDTIKDLLVGVFLTIERDFGLDQMIVDQTLSGCASRVVIVL